MNIADIIAPERTRVADNVQSKKRALERLAELLAEATPYLHASEILNGLVAREKLGSTGIGDGVAIPHARMKGIDDCAGAFIRFAEPVAFDAADEQPVDLVFGLLVPEQSTQAHLDLLRRLAEMFSEPDCLSSLRGAGDGQALFDGLTRHSRMASSDTD